MEKMNQAFEKMKMLVGMEVEDEEQPQEESSFAFMEDFNRNCTLSTKQRLYGFVTCLVAGITCTLLSMLVFFSPIKFGVTFSFGNLLALGRFVFRDIYYMLSTFFFLAVYVFQKHSASVISSLNTLPLPHYPKCFSGFLIGPKRQVAMMLDPVRIYATALYIASIIVALFCAVYVHNKLLTLVAIILEFGALIWYSLSYIPFARSMVSKIMVSCFDTEF